MELISWVFWLAAFAVTAFLSIKKSHNNRRYLLFFLAWYPFLPGSFGIALSESLPLLTVNRVLLLILFVYYCSRLHYIKLTFLRKHAYLIGFFVLAVVCNLVAFPAYSGAVKSLFAVIVEELLLLILLVNLLNDRDTLYAGLDVLLCVFGIICLVGVLQTVTGENLADVLKAVTTRGELTAEIEMRMGRVRASSVLNAISFANLCVFMAPLIMYMYETTRRWKYLILLTLDVVALVCTMTRGALFNLAFIVVVMLIERGQKFFNHYLRYVLVALGAGVLLCVVSSSIRDIVLGVFQSLLNVFGLDAKIENFGANMTRGVVSRTEQWTGILWALKHNPVFGFGPDAYARGLIYYYSAEAGWYPARALDTGFTSIIAQYGCVGGVAYLLLFGCLVVGAFRRSYRGPKNNMNQAFKYCFLLLFTLNTTSAFLDQNIFWIVTAMYLAYNTHRLYQPIACKEALY